MSSETGKIDVKAGDKCSNKHEKKKKVKVKVFEKRNKYNERENIFIEKLQQKYENIDTKTIKSFADFPLSPKTLKGLKQSGFNKPTEIQLETIGLALRGKDILGAAQTGSGKTLAFLIPILEVLFCKQWTHMDGLGALVITPTRELAYQIFETLRKIGLFHDFSAGLVIGGKDLKFERKRMDQCNIIICTPGRLLQHMDENPLFDCVNMQILVLDEADRCLDMGFQQTMNAIIANLPPKRQTLLFSATQTKSVKDLARLSLKDPSYVSVHENAEHSTPKGLQQNYVICNLEHKISIIWSFIRNHLKQKSVIFLSSCKQVKYVYEIFCRLRPGTSLLALYGTLHQLRRMEIYETFCRKTSAVLFATDLASRGLDFPEVHWVVQADCPEDAETYIHRAGRTARYHRGGESLLLLLPSEVAMVDELKQRKTPINKIEINPLKLNNPVRKMEAFLARDPSLKDTAQRAFVAYAKSVFLMKNKNIFDVRTLDTDAYAMSLGLAIPPRIRFLQRMNAKNNSTFLPAPNKTPISGSNEETKLDFRDSGASDDDVPIPDKLEDSVPFEVSDDSDDGILKVKRIDHDIELPSNNEMEMNNANKTKNKKKAVTKAALAKKILKKKIVANTKVVFNEEGEAVLHPTKAKQSELAQEYENEDVGGIDIEKARKVLREEDHFDKKLFKEKVKAKHKDTKRKLKERKRQEQQAKDEFDSESEDEPDVSWLPDPDKLYGEKNDSDSNIFDEYNNDKEKPEFNETKNSSDSDQNSDKLLNESRNSEETIQKSKKRKFKIMKPKQEAKKKKIRKLDDIAATLSVNEAEELAMMLLNNK